jgi:hypothetical protein
MSDHLEDAMAELVPLDSPARHLNGDEGMTPEREAHLARVLHSHGGLVAEKYRAGQRNHGGTLHKKPGMLRSAREESADLAVYLETLHEQIAALADDIDAERVSAKFAASVLRAFLGAS